MLSKFTQKKLARRNFLIYFKAIGCVESDGCISPAFGTQQVGLSTLKNNSVEN